MTSILNVKVQTLNNFNGTYTINFTPANSEVNTFGLGEGHLITIGTLDVPTDTFPSAQDAIDYYVPVVGAAIVNTINTIAGATLYTLGGPVQFDSNIQDALDAKANSTGIVRTTSANTLSLVGTGATGTQVSATKASTVRYTVSTSTTSSIGGPGTSKVDLKICSTNSSTEADWTTVGTVENDQTITLALTLNSVQVVKGEVETDVPAGWYHKLVNSGSGTHSETFISGQKTIYG